MKRSWSLVLLIVFGFSLFNHAQPVEIEWGPSKEMPRGMGFYKTIGKDSERFFVIQNERSDRFEKGEIILKSFSLASMLEESSTKLDMPLVYNKPTKFNDIFYLDGKIILFSSVIEGSTLLSTTYAHIIDDDGNILSDPKRIGQFPLATDADEGMVFKTNQDNSLIVGSYNTMFKVYSGEPFIFKYIDSELNIVETKELALPYRDRQFTVNDYLFGKGGNIYLGIKAKKVSKKRSSRSRGGRVVSEKFDWRILVFNELKDSLQEYKILATKYLPVTMYMEMNNDEDLIIGGFFTKKSDDIFQGVYYKRLIPRFERFDVEREILFTKDRSFLAEFQEERNGESQAQQFSYGNERFVHLINGGLVFMSEQKYFTGTKVVDPKTKKEKHIRYYHNGDILAVAINAEEKFEWYSRIPKNQFGTNDGGYYSGFIASPAGNKVKVMYNDHPKNFKQKDRSKLKELKNNVSLNPDGEAVLTTVYFDGSTDKTKLFPKEDKKTKICPRLFIDDDGMIVIYGQDGKDYKWGNFFFE